MKLPIDRVIIASDVSGVKIYRDDKIISKIFRDETKRTVTFFQQDISLDLFEESIQTFKKEIPWNFID